MACDPGLATVAASACGAEPLLPLAVSAVAVLVVGVAVGWSPVRRALPVAEPVAVRLGLPVRSLVVCTMATGLLAFLAGYYAASGMPELAAVALLGAAIAQVFVWVPMPGGTPAQA